MLKRNSTDAEIEQLLRKEEITILNDGENSLSVVNLLTRLKGNQVVRKLILSNSRSDFSIQDLSDSINQSAIKDCEINGYYDPECLNRFARTIADSSIIETLSFKYR